MSSGFMHAQLRRTWWWVFGVLIAAPALVLALLGLRAFRADRLEREQQLRDQQGQTAHLADAAIENAIDPALSLHSPRLRNSIFPSFSWIERV
jgi:hypothetical protein